MVLARKQYFGEEMNRWKEDFDKHPIHETLSWLNDAASSNVKNLSEGEVEEQRRLKKIIERYRMVLASIDPEIAPVNQIDSLNTALRHQNITNQVQAYVQNGKAAHLVSINNQISKNLTQLSIIQSLFDNPESQDRISYIDSVVDSTINGLSAKKEILEAQLSNVSALTEAHAKQLDSLSEQIEQKKSELSKLTSDWQNQFSSAQESRSQDFNKWRDIFASEKARETQEIIDEHDEVLKSQESLIKKELERVIEDSKIKHQSILDLYELTAGDSVGAAYIQSADDEKDQANLWRKVSVSFIVLTVTWLVFSFFYNSHTLSSVRYSPNLSTSTEGGDKNEIKVVVSDSAGIELLPSTLDSFPWHTMLIAFSISAVLMWGAAYSAQQSTKHRNYEKRARWFALEVKAFHPFISSLEPPQQQELKKQLAERIFGQNSMSEVDSKVVDEHALKVVTDAFSRLLSKLPK